MFEQIQAAAKRLQGVAHHTPVLTSSRLNRELGAEVFFKCENFQKTGAFKFRGAYNSISQLTAAEKAAGVIAYSSGNHAQAIACVGQLLGVETTIVMPVDAPKLKLNATKGYGAKVITYNPATETREDIAAQLIHENPLTLIPPFNYRPVIAGQGTVALEFHQQQGNLETLLVPCGGAGLLSGSAVTTKHQQPLCQVIGIEPKLADDATQSFYSGKICVQPNPPTIADGTRTASVGDITFKLMQQYVDQMTTVSESSIKQAVSYLYYYLKIVVEPSGALGLAALLEGVVPADGKIGIILSGGNMDGSTLCEILSETASG